MSKHRPSRTIVITGGLGNLGSKLCRHLLTGSISNNTPPPKVILLEHPAFIDASKPPPHPDATIVPCDLGSPDLHELERILTCNGDKFGVVDTVIHFSAVNPYPNANWGESAQSMDHTFNIFQMAVKCHVRRVILASSNHVMGGYKDDTSYGPSSIHPNSPPNVGTVPIDPQTLQISGDAMPYAAAKLASERLAMTLGSIYAATTTFVVLRIGWCQPGENLPETLSAAGSPPEFLSTEGANDDDGSSSPNSNGGRMSEGDAKDELWFKQMWLSNRDYLQYFEAAIDLSIPTTSCEADRQYFSGRKPPPKVGVNVHRHVRNGFVLVNAMSANRDAKWNLDETKRLLGVVSKDDSLA
jgi:nucleoside-diphosphate-sugar epimerase